MFRRLLIANRGEVALRIITSAKKLGIATVAVYSEADQHSPHLAAADFKVCIGPPKAPQSYLYMDAILQAAEQFECQAVHPGFGFLSENALFSERCRQQQLTFVGPTAKAIRTMGDKVTAKRTMQAAGLPLIPGSDGLLRDVNHAVEVAGRIGYPVMIKATSGGGGRGMRICRDEADLRSHFPTASLEAEKAFGNPAMYMEKYIQRGRHIEFQVLGDAFGRLIHLGERECSVQRKHQKLIEESPSPAMSNELRQSMGSRITTALARVGYRNAGTCEMLMDADTGELYFMEMNCRLQVEHGVTELLCGLDIVAEQLRIAAHEPMKIRQAEVTWHGHALECRVNAEDPALDFKPSPGRLTNFVAPTGATYFNSTEPKPALPRVRIDSHVTTGYEIPPYYDSMIAKVLTHAEDRGGAIAAMQKALGELRVEGVPTTVGLHQRVLAAAPFASGRYDTRFLEGLLAGA